MSPPPRSARLRAAPRHAGAAAATKAGPRRRRWGAMTSREARIARDLAAEPTAHLQAWLAAGRRLLADPQTPARQRAAVLGQVAACRQLLARRSPGAGLPGDAE